MAATTCLVLANAEGLNAVRAGLAPREAANANLLRRVAPTGSLSRRGKEPMSYNPAKRHAGGEDEPWNPAYPLNDAGDAGDSEEDTDSEATTTKVASTTKVKASPGAQPP